jgi:hypothetical protein
MVLTLKFDELKGACGFDKLLVVLLHLVCEAWAEKRRLLVFNIMVMF